MRKRRVEKMGSIEWVEKKVLKDRPKEESLGPSRGEGKGQLGKRVEEGSMRLD